MNKEDLSPEQLEAFTAAMAEAKMNTKRIVLTGLLLLVALMSVNVYLCFALEANEACRFFIYFSTTVLVVSSTNSQLIEESDRFREEAKKILDNKF